MRSLKYLRYLVFLVGLLLISFSFYLKWDKVLLRYFGIVLTVAGVIGLLWEYVNADRLDDGN